MQTKKTDDWTDFSIEEMEAHAARPIFIVGAPRSGTTLMRNIIDARPNICYPRFETFIFEYLNNIFNGNTWNRQYDKLPFGRDILIRWLRKFILDLFTNLTTKASKRHWVEKTPSHVLHMRIINEVFSDAQYIHMTRSGYDVVRSLKYVE